MRILLVEDDVMMGNSLQKGLGANGHAVDWLQDGSLVEGAVQSNTFDMLLLDLSLPGSDGLDILRSLRAARKRLPIIVITARADVKDRIAGLNLGADDYLAKPFSFEELEARIRAVERRISGFADTIVRFGPLNCNTATREVEFLGEKINLSSREYQILSALLSRPGAIVSKAQLTEKIYDWDSEIDSNALEVHIHRLRQKLSTKFIRTVRGLGYQLVDEPLQ